METIIEKWLPVVGFEGFYEVSNTGKLRGVERKVLGSGKQHTRTAAGKDKKLYVGMTGYPVAQLCRNGKQRLRPIHRLVAEAFIPNPNNYPVVNHLDGNKLNNNVSNLEWCTYKRNSVHAVEIGLNKCKKRVMNVDTGEVYESESEAAIAVGMSFQAVSLSAIRGIGRIKWKFVD